MGPARLARRRSLVALLFAAAAGVAAAGCGGDSGPGVTPFPRGAAAKVADPRTVVPLGTAVRLDRLEGDPELRALVAKAFDSVTPENEMKFEVVEPQRGRFDFGAADTIVGFAARNGLQVRGHTLVWHQQVPGWLSDGDFSAAELQAILEEHIRTVVGRYRGQVGTWDVVNEPFTDRGGFRTSAESPWLKGLGPRYIELALRAARAADPGARLFVNEIGAEKGGPKLDALVELARQSKRRGVPLDGIGLESHLSAKAPPSETQWLTTLRRLAATGVDVELTELDVAGGAPASAYGDAANACAAVPACKRVTIWGVSDRDSWLGQDAGALPFDAQLRPKPAWAVVTRALARRRPRR